MDDQTQNNSFNLNSAAPNPVPQQENPLNTGNGIATPTAESTPSVTPVAPEPPVSTIENVPVVAPSSESNFKKYIIITIVAVLILGGGAMAYFQYFSDPTTTSEAQEEENIELNTLSDSEDPDSSAKMEELETVVEDLKDVYSEQGDGSAPPTITIDLSEESTPEETITEEAPSEEPTAKKIPR